MAINIKFDLAGNPEPPTIILATRSGKKLGQLNVDSKSIELSDKFNDVSEISFTLNKYIDEKITNLWDKVVDFKLIYCKEWDMWFEITVELDEATETIKTVLGKQLGQVELSNINLYGVYVNEEGDPNWNVEENDYKITILYDKEHPETSLLHRLLKDKAPHYSIEHVDDTIKNIQRSFSFDDISICDAFQKIAEEIGCLFVYHSNSDVGGKIKRAISVYDLQQTCIDCGYRGEFTDECPKCEGKNIKYGYGDDTLIFVTSDELAADGIQLVTDTDSVKNCFKLEAGDDLMTATIRNCNPNGTDYIWYFSDDIKEDMSDELVNKLQEYDALQNEYRKKDIELDEGLVDTYNNLVDKYKVYYNAKSSMCFDCDYKGDFDGNCPSCKSDNVLIGNRLTEMPTSVKGYSSLMSVYYDTIDFSLYLESGLMPSVEISNTTAKEQVKLLTPSSLSPIAVTNIKVASLSTVENNIEAMAKTIIKSTYAIDIKEEKDAEGKDIQRLFDNDDGTKTWKGIFVITNYSDENDCAESDYISLVINDDFESYVVQKLEKALNKEDTEDLSISGLFAKDYDDFCTELKRYALEPLTTFNEACRACLTILQDQGVGNKDTWASTEEGSESNLYEKLYLPYFNKSAAIETEKAVRSDEIQSIKNLQLNINECRTEIQQILNFESFLGDLWLEFCAYRKEDKYSNENYISDGLNNAKLFERALAFYEVAENEIYKSAELQHSISTTLNNLLAIPKFKPLVDSFKVGNWIRVRVDDRIYKLRLLEYDIDYSDFNNIPVEFSDVTKIKNGITDTRDILSQASSMASSYSSVKRQANQGEKSNTTLNSWFKEGLKVTDTKIVDSVDENLLFDKYGFLCRQYDPMTGTYSPEQIKIIGSTIAITDDNWKNTKTAIGKFYYVDPITGEEKTGYGINGETLVGKFILGENIILQNESGNMVFDGDGLTIVSVSDDGVGTMTFDENGLIVKHGDNTVTISPKSEEVMNITNGEDKVFEVDENGELSINGNIIARSLRLENGVTIDSGVITNLADVATTASYEDLIDVPTKLSDFKNDGVFITKDTNNLANYYKKTETYTQTQVDNLLNAKVNASNLSTVATSGSYNDLVDINELKAWVLEQIQFATGQQ